MPIDASYGYTSEDTRTPTTITSYKTDSPKAVLNAKIALTALIVIAVLGVLFAPHTLMALPLAAKLVGGGAPLMLGGFIYYKTCYQPKAAIQKHHKLKKPPSPDELHELEADTKRRVQLEVASERALKDYDKYVEKDKDGRILKDMFQTEEHLSSTIDRVNKSPRNRRLDELELLNRFKTQVEQT